MMKHGTVTGKLFMINIVKRGPGNKRQAMTKNNFEHNFMPLKLAGACSFSNCTNSLYTVLHGWLLSGEN